MGTIGSAPTGTRGTLIIDDDGYYIRFYLSQGDSATFIGSPGKDWWGTVNGVAVGGKWTWASGGGTRLIAGPWAVTYTQSIGFAIGATGTQGFGGGATAYGTAGRATVPGTPGTPSASNVQPTSMTLSWAIPGNGGANIDQMLLRRSTDPNFGSYVDYPLAGNVSSHSVTGLTPNTTYYWRVYAHNGIGYSSPSGTLTQATLPSTPPGLSVLPNIPGTNATATLIPPGNATGVTKYTLETRALGTTTPVTTIESPTSPIVITPRTPGASYEYRASAWFGTYQSPWSDWIAVAQPNPNTSQGTYFDGNTPDTPVLDYGWDGAAGNSVSRAKAFSVAGWKTFPQSSVTSGGTGVVFRAAGGFAGSYAARALFMTDATASGFSFGTGDGPTLSQLADVEPGAPYVASVYVQPSKSQRLRLAVQWWTVTGTFISTTPSLTPEVIDPGGYTRMVATFTPPANAQYASLVVQDIGGAGWSLWRAGDWLQLDAAMMTLQDLFDYFDGSTPDTNTFQYDWEGLPNASVSSRTTLVGNVIDPLLDPDCPPPPLPPSAPVITDDCITEVGTWRRYWAVIPSSEISDHLKMIPTVRVTTGGVEAKQVRVRIYENPEDLAPEQFDDSGWMSEQIISYMPPLTTMTLDGVDKRAYAEVNGGGPIPADKLLYGTGGTPPSWALLSCGIGYLLSFDVPLDAPAGNVSIGIDLTRRVS